MGRRPVAFGVLLAIGGRSETIRLLRGDEDDERTLALEAQATTVTALVLTVALALLFLASGIRGEESGTVYALLLILAGACAATRFTTRGNQLDNRLPISVPPVRH